MWRSLVRPACLRGAIGLFDGLQLMIIEGMYEYFALGNLPYSI